MRLRPPQTTSVLASTLLALVPSERSTFSYHAVIKL